MSNNTLRKALAVPPRALPGRPIPKLKTRKPTGLPSWPLILVEGPEKSGKSWAAAEFTASDRISQAYWLDWGEGAADEYAAIPGANYEVIDHDGSWHDIVGQLEAVCLEGARVLQEGGKPVLLVIDSMTAAWEQLKNWAHHRAASTDRAKRMLERNPNAEIDVPMHIWNSVNERHARVMRMLMRFPGIVVVTARGKEVAVVDSQGRPVDNRKENRVEGHKTLGFDATAWVRLSRDSAPMIVGARSVHSGIRPGIDAPMTVQNFSLDWLVFDLLLKGTDGKAGQARALPEPAPARDESRVHDHEVDWAAEMEAARGDRDKLAELWRRATTQGAPTEIVEAIKTAGQQANGHTTPGNDAQDK
jgi:hypothetical protein